MLSPRWLLLIHQIPARPNYLRAKAGKLILRAGGVPYKNSVYVLPNDPDRLAAANRVLRAITEGGGGCVVVEASFVAGLADGQVEQLFRDAVDAACGAALDQALTGTPDPEQIRLLERVYGEQAAADAFGSPVRERLRRALDRLASGPDPISPPRAGTWVARQDAGVDVLASAWLILRFIDPDATIRFADVPRASAVEVSFAALGSDFPATLDTCAFEALRRAFSVDAPGLAALAEVVHDVALEEDRYGHDEAIRVVLFVDGLLATHIGDEERLRRACLFFDDLLVGLARSGATPRPAR